MKQLTILLFLLSLAATAVGQTIRGRVVDDDSGEPLSAASVYVRSIGKGTTSDGDGYFSLQVADGKTVELRVSYVGYKDAVVQARPGRTTLEVRLHRANELRGVQVYGARHDFGVQSSQMSAEVLTAAQVKEMPALFGEIDVMKSLQRLPGV